MTPAEKLHDAASRFLFMTRTTLLWETERRQQRFETLATEFKEALRAYEDSEGITAKRQEDSKVEISNWHPRFGFEPTNSEKYSR